MKTNKLFKTFLTAGLVATTLLTGLFKKIPISALTLHFVLPML